MFIVAWYISHLRSSTNDYLDGGGMELFSWRNDGRGLFASRLSSSAFLSANPVTDWLQMDKKMLWSRNAILLSVTVRCLHAKNMEAYSTRHVFPHWLAALGNVYAASRQPGLARFEASRRQRMTTCTRVTTTHYTHDSEPGLLSSFNVSVRARVTTHQVTSAPFFATAVCGALRVVRTRGKTVCRTRAKRFPLYCPESKKHANTCAGKTSSGTKRFLIVPCRLSALAYTPSEMIDCAMLSFSRIWINIFFLSVDVGVTTWWLPLRGELVLSR